MGEIIKFPSRRISSSSCSNLVRNNDKFKTKVDLSSDSEGKTPIFSQQEDEAFLELVQEWPCFQNLPASMTLQDLFQLYHDDELTLAQDCALEFMLHMHDPESTFDIGNALYTWEEDDRDFFLTSITMHAEMIDKIKQEEL
jgi:hypothetical protein